MLRKLQNAILSSEAGSSLRGIVASDKGRVAIGLLVFTYLQAGIAFGINLWLANRLGDDIYGILSFGLVMAAICGALVNFGSERTLVRDLVHAKDPKEMLAASVVMRLIAATLFGIGGIAWIVLDNPLGDRLWIVALCAVSGALVGLSPRGWYDIHYKMNIHAGMLMSERILYGASVLLLVGAAAGMDGALVAAFCLFASRMIGFLVQWGYAQKSSCLVFRNLKSNVPWLIRQNTLVFGATLGNMAAPYINQIVLGHQQGNAQLAHFFIAFQIITVVQLFQQIVSRLLLPRIAEVTSPESTSSLAKSRFIRFSLYSSVAAISLVIPIVLAASWLVNICLPPSYAPAVLPLRILAVACIPFGIGLVATNFLICLRRNARFFSTAISKGILAILLGQVLIPKYGGVGVALTILICATLFMMILCGLAWLAIPSLDNRRDLEV